MNNKPLTQMDQIKLLFTDKDDFLFIALPLLTLLGLIIFIGISAIALAVKLF